MNEILIIFLIFGTLFIVESKSIYLLAYYVAMVILIAILINIYPNFYNTLQYSCDISYISYILVLVQISAITILFGFIIMLYPTNNTDILIRQRNLRKEKKSLVKKYSNIFSIFIVFSICYVAIFEFIIDKYLFEIMGLVETMCQFDIYNRIIYFLTDNILEIYYPYNIIIMDNNVSLFIHKISYLLYTDPSNIFKFIVITIILLFAIICLFFLLFPTIKK